MNKYKLIINIHIITNKNDKSNKITKALSKMNVKAETIKQNLIKLLKG